MENLNIMWAWIQANPIVFTAIVVYVIANLAPRPHPEKIVGWKKTFWEIIDGLCLLTAARVPGKIKWLLAGSPPIESETHVAEKEPVSEADDGPDEKEEESEQPTSKDDDK